MTSINWNEYFETTEHIVEEHTKDEGPFATVTLRKQKSDGFQKVHIGLENGEILDSKSFEVVEDSLSQTDHHELLTEVQG